MLFRVARAVLPALSGYADQFGKADAFNHHLLWQAQYVDEALIPDAQTKVFVKNTDPLRQARNNGLQIGQVQVWMFAV